MFFCISERKQRTKYKQSEETKKHNRKQNSTQDKENGSLQFLFNLVFLDMPRLRGSNFRVFDKSELTVSSDLFGVNVLQNQGAYWFDALVSLLVAFSMTTMHVSFFSFLIPSFLVYYLRRLLYQLCSKYRFVVRVRVHQTDLILALISAWYPLLEFVFHI